MFKNISFTCSVIRYALPQTKFPVICNESLFRRRLSQEKGSIPVRVIQ